MTDKKSCRKCVHVEVCGRLSSITSIIVDALEILDPIRHGALGHLQDLAKEFAAPNCHEYCTENSR